MFTRRYGYTIRGRGRAQDPSIQVTGASATAYLAQVNWLLGDVGQARKTMEDAVARSLESAHVPTLANVYGFKGVFEIFCGDAAAA